MKCADGGSELQQWDGRWLCALLQPLQELISGVIAIRFLNLSTLTLLDGFCSSAQSFFSRSAHFTFQLPPDWGLHCERPVLVEGPPAELGFNRRFNTNKWNLLNMQSDLIILATTVGGSLGWSKWWCWRSTATTNRVGRAQDNSCSGLSSDPVRPMNTYTHQLCPSILM